MRDLVALVPDKNTKFVLQGLFPRIEAFQIRPFEYDIYIHPERAPGVYHKAGNLLRPLRNQYRYALVFLDREGSGQERKTVATIESEIKDNLVRSHWENRVEVIVFEPELEIWAWLNSPHVAKNLGWDYFQYLRNFLHENAQWPENLQKPPRPKEAVELALREKRIPRSSAIYKKIAENVSFRECREPSFLKFKRVLKSWFPADSSQALTF